MMASPRMLPRCRYARQRRHAGIRRRFRCHFPALLKECRCCFAAADYATMRRSRCALAADAVVDFSRPAAVLPDMLLTPMLFAFAAVYDAADITRRCR